MRGKRAESDIRTVVGKRVRSGKPAVLCSHGPVLPEILTEIALATGTLRGSYLGSASALGAAAFSVVHLSADEPRFGHRRDRDAHPEGVSTQPGSTLLAGVRVAWEPVPSGRHRRDVADALVARIANASAGASATVSRRCERCGSTDHGRPLVAGAPVHASISYAANLVVVAVADACRVLALGIDAERTGRARNRDLRGVVSPGQRTSLRHWTRVEAVLKADGRGLSVAPGRVRIERSLRGVHGSIVDADIRTERGALGIRPRLLRVHGPRGVVISLAVASV